MKKLLFLLLALPMVVGCYQGTRQQETKQSEELTQIVHNAVYETFPDVHNYEPISTDVDSIFNSVIYEEGVIDSLFSIIVTLSDISFIEGGIDDLDRFIFLKDSLWIYKALDIYENVDRTDKNLATYADKVNNYMCFVKEKDSQRNDDGHFGWLVKHNFRCSNNVGFKDNASIVFVLKKDMKTRATDVFEPEFYKKSMRVFGELITYIRQKDAL